MRTTRGITSLGCVIVAMLMASCDIMIKPTASSASNARLEALTLSAGPLDPAFKSDQTDYTVTAGFPVASTIVTATAEDANATLTINGAPCASGIPSAPLVLTAGTTTTITIVVMSADGVTRNTYTIAVTRQSAALFAQQAYVKASNTDINDNFGYVVALDGDTMAVTGHWESSSATGVNGNQADNSLPSSGAVYVFIRSGTSWTQQAYIKASNTGTGDSFGQSIALSGDTLAVGAWQEDSDAAGVNGDQGNDLALGSGAVYIFTRTGTTWSQQAYLKSSNSGTADAFGWSVSLSGDTLAVGARLESSSAAGVSGDQTDNSSPSSGAVYVFTRNGTTWAQQAYLKSSNTGTNDEFGTSVALSGDTLAVGARLEDSNATGVNGDQNNDGADGSGAVYVFTRSGTTWTQQAYLKSSNTGTHDYFGESVALSGDTLVVGAKYEASNAIGVNGDQSNDLAADSGAVYVFTRSGTTWTQEAYIKPSNTGSGDLFGYAVALSGDTLAVGAAGEDSSAAGVNGDQSNNAAAGSGAVYLFTRSGGIWTQQAYIKPSNTGSGDLFGYSVALSGGTLAAGALYEASSAMGVNGNQADNSASGSGAVYMFR